MTKKRRGRGEGGVFQRADGLWVGTMLLLADVPAKVVSERLGHSSIAITLDTYSHVLPTMQKRAASVLGTILGAAAKPARKETRKAMR